MVKRLLHLHLHHDKGVLACFRPGSVLCFENRALFFTVRDLKMAQCSQPFHVHEKTLSYHVNLRREASM